MLYSRYFSTDGYKEKAVSLGRYQDSLLKHILPKNILILRYCTITEHKVGNLLLSNLLLSLKYHWCTYHPAVAVTANETETSSNKYSLPTVILKSDKWFKSTEELSKIKWLVFHSFLYIKFYEDTTVMKVMSKNVCLLGIKCHTTQSLM